ncbi:MAG: site-2 protease family protein [Pseudomonadales bacterium]
MSEAAPNQLPLTPALREDLRLYELGSSIDGEPIWAIQDPAANRFFRIGWLEYECLLRWPGKPEDIATDIEATTPLTIDPEQVSEFARFLDAHQLSLPSAATQQRIQQAAREPGWRHWKWWLHHYLFIRIPVVRPQRFLQKLTLWLEPLFSKGAVILLLLACLLGLVLVAHQWEHFTHSALDSLTPSGLLGFAIALIVSKSLHELGHAVVATRMGVRVAHMGIAFLVMWPMLYTDTGESWRLRSPRQRLAISSAGVATELALAGLATLAWALLDDGAMRQAALYLATTGWVLSLVLNISPFMRFDGYFILSDLINFPNLHERSGALTRVWLRRSLLGLNDAWPETFSQKARRSLIAFALTTWTYRFIVFLGIAVTVYFLFFKLLGICLMMVEIIWFVIRPIWTEFAVWKKRWPEVKNRRKHILYGSFFALLILLLVPWRFDITAQGVAHAERQQLVFAPFPSQLSEIHATGKVSEGEILSAFAAPDLAARAAQLIASRNAFEHRLSGLLDTDNQGLNKRLALTQRLAEQQTELLGIQEENDRLVIRAEFSGQWRDISPLIRQGTWVGVRDKLGVLFDPSSWVVEAYVEQRAIDRIALGAAASFLPQGSLKALSGQVVEIDTTRSQRLSHPMLSSTYGGKLSTVPNNKTQEAVPSDALYRVRIRLHQVPQRCHEKCTRHYSPTRPAQQPRLGRTPREHSRY